MAAVTTGSGNFIGIGAGLTGITDMMNGNQIGTPAAPKNPLLGPLQNNGGMTPTRSPLPGSPVIDAGVNAAVPTADPITGNPTTDQRGLHRFGQGLPASATALVDIGAVEFQQPATTTTLMVSATSVPTTQSVMLTATVTGTGMGANPPTGTVTFLDNGTSVGTAMLQPGSAASSQ